MGPDYSEMLQKEENMIINNSLVVSDSFGEKSYNEDHSVSISDEDNLNDSASLSEELRNSSSDNQILDTDSRNVKYFVTAGNSPLSVVIKRCNNFSALSEDSCSNPFNGVYNSPTSSTSENLQEDNSNQSESDIELNGDLKLIGSLHQPSTQSSNESLINKPCTVIEYVETIKSLIDMGLDVSESDQYNHPQVIFDGSKSLVEILQGSQPLNADEISNKPKKLHNNEDDTCCLKSSFPSPQQEQSEILSHSDRKNSVLGVLGSQPLYSEENSNEPRIFVKNEENFLKSCLPLAQREQTEEFLCNSDTTNSGLAATTENDCPSPNAQVERQSTGSPIRRDNFPICPNGGLYVVLDDLSLQSANTEPGQKLEVETHNCIHEDSNSSLKSDHLQSDTANFQLQGQTVHCQDASIVQSDGETFDLQLKATNYFDETRLIDTEVDRIVYSPTLFSDDEDTENSLSHASGTRRKSPSDVFCRRSRTTEARRLKQLQISMIGLPPPPSVTNPQLSVNDLLRSLQENEAAMSWPETSLEEKELHAKHLKDAKESAWPDSTLFCHPDIYYNNGLRSEQFATISQKFAQRYVGAETACFCNIAVSTGSARKRNKKLGVGFSPGRRLSHLARRRKAFSRDNLLSTSAGGMPKSQPNALAERRQIVIASKMKISLNRPVTSKPSLNVKTAVSAGSRALSHKRALFQSPDKSKKNPSAKKSLSGSKRKNNFRSGVESFKRALFGSASKESKELPDVKRSRSSDTQLFVSSSKRKLLFDNVETPSRVPAAQVASSTKEKLIGKLNNPGSSSTKKVDAKSTIMNSEHKKKLLWAVAESLRKKGITMSHALFRPCVSSLVRICRSLMPDLQHHSGSTSELMLEIANKYASDIVREKKAEADLL